MDLENTLKGTVSRFYPEKMYGFIETESKISYFFFDDKTIYKTAKERYSSHHFCSGDEVEFKLKKYEGEKVIAYDLKFIQNTKLDKIIEEATELNVLKGYLKKIEKEYFIKHLGTYLFIPIKISDWETDLNIVYEERINKLLTFELHDLNKPFKLYGTLTDRIFNPEYTLINELRDNESTTFTTITGKNNNGFFATLFNGSIKCFIRFLNSEDEKLSCKDKGDIVEVQVVNVFPENKTVYLKIVHRKENDSNVKLKDFVFRQEHFGESTVEKTKRTLIKRTHGIVVNSLAAELSERGLLVANDANRDLFIHNNKKEIKCIFEIKTSASTQSIYAAVGQLIIYSIPTLVKSGLLLVIPDLLNEKIKMRLEGLGIKILYYSWHNEKPIFHELDNTVNDVIETEEITCNNK